jgi:hypothetical protein
MPTLVNIGGLKIQMFPSDHNPPHVHVVRGDTEAMVALADLRVLAGTIRSRDLELARTWMRKNTERLENEWRRLR